jgi:Ni/Co efflux regulator RcnB
MVFAIAAASLGFSALSFAEGNDRHGPREDQFRRHQRYERRDEGRTGRWDDRRFDRYDDRRNDRRAYYNARGPEFRRGGYVPREFHNHRYVVTDYRAYRLSPPPRGHEWVQVGPDFVLIAIATGLIAHIVLSQ